MPEAAGAGAAAPNPAVEAMPGWAARLIESGADPQVVREAVQEAQAAPPPSPEARVSAAEEHRAQARRDLEASTASAEHTRLHGESLVRGAAGQQAKAQADYERAMENAARIEAGEPAEGPPEAPPAEGEGM